jgi:hypothetical protein
MRHESEIRITGRSFWQFFSSTRSNSRSFQPLIDKTVTKFNGWNGRNLNLGDVVLTLQVVYFATAMKSE